RHMGIHPCGMVISAKPLTRLTPLERATKGIVVTQYDMNSIEDLGLIKMDLLGQRGFTTMSLALDNIERNLRFVGAQHAAPAFETSSVAPDGVTPCPKPRELDFDAIPENDPATCDVIAAGRTMGVFQIESPAMRGMLRMMNARTLEEMAIALAIIRPGAAEYGSKELFVKRLRGKEKTVYPHDSLEPILRDTLGVCIYQEQVMQIAQSLGKMSLAEADLVRRSSVKYSGRADHDRLRGAAAVGESFPDGLYRGGRPGWTTRAPRRADADQRPTHRNHHRYRSHPRRSRAVLLSRRFSAPRSRRTR